MPTRRVYIDSRYRMPGGSDSDFRYALKTPIEVAPGTLGFIDGVVLSQSFGCIAAGYNDTVFVREVYQAATTDRVFTLDAGEYNGYTLATELAAKLNAGTTLPQGCAVTFADGRLTVASQTPAAQGGAYLLTQVAIETNALSPAWGTTTTPTPPALSSSADACRVLGQLEGLSGAIDSLQSLRMNPIDLMPYRQLFLHSHIGACSSQGPRGENTIVRRVVITGGPGDLIADFHHTTSDYIELGGQLSTLHFSLRDVEGNVVDTKGHPVSFSLCLTEGA